MRAATFIAPAGPPQAVSADPRDVLERGEAPRHRVAGPVFLQNGTRLLLRGDPGDPILVRLPRRLTRLGFGNPANDSEPLSGALRWIRGLAPHMRDLLQLQAIGLVDAGEDPLAGRSDVERLWELWYPRRGLGLPKPLPRRRTPRRPLTLWDLRQRAAEYQAEDYRNNGLVDIELDDREVDEVRSDPEYILMERGGVHGDGSEPLPDRCFAIVAGMRLFRRQSMFEHISSSLHRLGVDCGQALNTAARERLLGARAAVEEAAERAAPGTRVVSYEVSDDGVVSVQLLAPLKAIQLRMVVSSDVVKVTGG